MIPLRKVPLFLLLMAGIVAGAWMVGWSIIVVIALIVGAVTEGMQ